VLPVRTVLGWSKVQKNLYGVGPAMPFAFCTSEAVLIRSRLSIGAGGVVTDTAETKSVFVRVHHRLLAIPVHPESNMCLSRSAGP
jgi:hypothetical protein